MPKVALIMGSKSDCDLLKDCIETLKAFNIQFDVRVISAHRTPDEAVDFAKGAREAGYEVLICAAGKAAHLAGVVAAYTTIPVIGIPIQASALDGMDALLSMVQMPPGVPVAVVAINGAANAALLAVQILSGAHTELVDEMNAYRIRQADKVRKADGEVSAKFSSN